MESMKGTCKATSELERMSEILNFFIHKYAYLYSVLFCIIVVPTYVFMPIISMIIYGLVSLSWPFIYLCLWSYMWFWFPFHYLCLSTYAHNFCDRIWSSFPLLTMHLFGPMIIYVSASPLIVHVYLFMPIMFMIIYVV